MNKVLGYRKMIGLTQLQMANELGISENQYRAKEKGKYDFSKTEMEKYHEVVKKTMKDIKIQDIFFN